MNIHKLVGTSRSPVADLDYSRLNNSRLHNYSESQNMTTLRQRQPERSLKGSFKENQQSIYRISSLLMHQHNMKSQKALMQMPRFDKSVALFSSNRERSRSRNPSSSISQSKPIETAKPVAKKTQSVLQAKVKPLSSAKENVEPEQAPKTISTLPHRGRLNRNFEARF
jgi:hypothetical protein